MIDLGEIMKNDAVKDIFQKIGVPQDKVEAAAEQAATSISGKAAKDPKKMIGLLSPHENTNEENELSNEVENDFVQGLVDKVGIPAGIADNLKGVLPDLLKQFSGPLTEKIASVAGGSILESVVDMFDGDNDKGDKKKDESGGLGSMIGGLFGN